MPASPEDVSTLLAALRGAVAVPGATERPGRLRQQLESQLGPDESVRLRRLVHQVVAASEENLPHDLRRITPLTTQSLQRLSQDLAAARGWSADAAERTTHLWASALGFADLAASSWPREPAAAQSSASLTGAPVPPSQTLLPHAPPFRAVPPAAPAAAPDWPPAPKSLARHTTNLVGEPALGVALGYAGMSLVMCVGLTVAMTVALCLPILFVGATGGILPVLGIVGAKALISRLGRGALVASASGLEFTPYDTSLRAPRAEQSFGAVWSQVAVEQGRVSVVRFAGRRVQVGPRNSAFAEALAACARGTR